MNNKIQRSALCGSMSFALQRTGANRGSAVRRLPLLLLLLGWLAATPAQAQIGTPVDLGSNFVPMAGGTSVSMTTSAAVPMGASIIVMAHDATGDAEDLRPADSASCADIAGNPYTTDVTRSNFLNPMTTVICSTHHIAAMLPSGSTITVTWSGVIGTQSYLIRAFAVTGLATTPLDQTASDANTSTSPSSGAVTTTQANELLVGAISYDSNLAGFSPGTGYTPLGGVGSGPFLFGEYQIVSATGSYAATGSLTSLSHWEALLATYKAAPIVFDTCLKDNSTGNLLQWNSTTGVYKFTRCSDGFMITGTGVAKLVNGIQTLTDFKSNIRLSAGFNTGQLTGNATIYLMIAQGVWQTFRIIDTNPNAVCACPG